MKSVGNILGATGGGLLCDLLWRHVDCIIAAALVGAAAETAMAPWTGSLELFGAMLFLQGLSEGIISAGKYNLAEPNFGREGSPNLI